MSAKRPSPPQDSLFDLPLESRDDLHSAAAGADDPADQGFENLSLFDEEPESAATHGRGSDGEAALGDTGSDRKIAGLRSSAREAATLHTAATQQTAELLEAPAPATVAADLAGASSFFEDELSTEEAAAAPNTPPGARVFAAGVSDSLLHLAALSLALLSIGQLGLRPHWTQWPGWTLFLLAFSFPYFTVPLAFWGATPGMSAWRLRARDQGARPLTFGQTALRWLGAWITTLTAGLGWLLLFSGTSLSDRLSGSVTVSSDEAIEDLVAA